MFAFLADLDRHWLISGRGVRRLSTDADGRGAVVRFGPPGLRRTTVTRIESIDPPASIRGSARSGATVAQVSWTLFTARDGGTRVRFEQLAAPGSRWDGLLLALARRLWLPRQYRLALRRLKRELEA